MVAEEALKAGCRFFAGYSIAPAFEVFRVMAEDLPRARGLAISAPDDIIALQYCIGAAMAGYKANVERLLAAVNGVPSRAACDATRM